MGRRKQRPIALELEDAEGLYAAVADEITEEGVTALIAIGMDPPDWRDLPLATQTFFLNVIRRFYR